MLVRVCAWCDTHIGVEPSHESGEAEATTHGLCRDCTEDLLMSVASPRRPAPGPSPRWIRTTLRRLNA
jgi:hypothetical protein